MSEHQGNTCRRCDAPECSKPAHPKGQLCSMHRARMARHGTLNPPPLPTHRDLYERAVIRTAEGCWGWSGPTNNHGYGRIGHAYAHRFSYEIHHGAIPKGQNVLHSCDNPPCTNPDHLGLGTQAQNVREAYERSRRAPIGQPGETNPHAKLTNAQVAEIRRRRAAGERNDHLAAEFGITRQYATRITTYADRRAG